MNNLNIIKKILSAPLVSTALCVSGSVLAQSALPSAPTNESIAFPAYRHYETVTETVRFNAILEPQEIIDDKSKALHTLSQSLLWIETDNFDYLFILGAAADQLRLSAHDIEEAFADSELRIRDWGDSQSAHAAVLSNVEVAPDKYNVRATLKYHRDAGAGFITLPLIGQRQRVSIESSYKETAALIDEYANKAASAHQTMRPVILGFGDISSSQNLVVEIDDTAAEALDKRWHATLGFFARGWKRLITPFALMLCNQCMPRHY